MTPEVHTAEFVEERPSQSLATVDERSKDFNYIQRVAKPMALSGLFGVTETQAIAKMMVGEALGIHPAVAMQQIYVVDGKVSMGATLMLSLARQHGWRHTVKKHDATGCILGWTDPSGVSVGESSFTIEDAKRVKMGAKDGKERTMADKDNWRNYPADMCFARAVTQGVRMYAPEITNGILVYSNEEAGDVGAPGREIQMPQRTSEAGL